MIFPPGEILHANLFTSYLNINELISNLAADEFVAYNGKADEDKTDIYDEVHGKYHFPFYYPDSEFKFIKRTIIF